MKTIYQLISPYAQEYPNKIALSGDNYLDESISLTYAQLIQQIDAISLVFTQMNIKCIALRANNSVDWALIDLAALNSKIPIIPVPLFFSSNQVNHLLSSTGADCLIGDWYGYRHSALLSPHTIANMPVYIHHHANILNFLPNTIKITFTSGSTGLPKGVCLSESNLVTVSLALANAIELKPKHHLAMLPLSTLLENISGIYVPLILGATSYLLKGQNVGLLGSSQLDIPRFAQAIMSYSPNTLVLTPALLKALIAIILKYPTASDSLEFVAVGGARVPESLVKQANALNIPIYEGYGLSECASVICLNTPSEQKAGSCGKPLPHVEVKIAEDGELFVRGNIALGYIGEPFAQTWLATGDLASKDEHGFYSIKGRKKNILISSFGRNISPEWIESELNAYFPNLTPIIIGEGENSLGLLLDIPMASAISPLDMADNTTFKQLLIQNIQNINDSLPDYAQITNVRVLNGLAAQSNLWTSNGRIKRDALQAWLVNADVNSLTNIYLHF